MKILRRRQHCARAGWAWFSRAKFFTRLCSSRAEEEQNSKDLINQQRTSGAEDTELTRILKSCKVCTLQLDISRGWSLATTTSGQAHHTRERTSSSTSTGGFGSHHRVPPHARTSRHVSGPEGGWRSWLWITASADPQAAAVSLCEVVYAPGLVGS